MKARGRVWRFGHNVDTDVITPGKYLYVEMPELARHALEVLDPAFPAGVKPGDVVLGGRNFGCGSSREHAPRALKYLGVSCVVAESFARIFQRNAIAIGLPVIAAPGLWEPTLGGDELEIDLESGDIRNLTSGARHTARPLPDRMLQVLRDGGIAAALKRLAAADNSTQAPHADADKGGW